MEIGHKKIRQNNKNIKGFIEFNQKDKFMNLQLKMYFIFKNSIFSEAVKMITINQKMLCSYILVWILIIT